MSNFNESAVLSIFPPALRKSPDYWTMAQVIAPELEMAFQAATQAEVLCRINEQPVEVLDELAKDLDIFWLNPNASLEDKRLGVIQALDSHRRLGTVKSVQDAINTYLGGGLVDEWFDYSADPYHFQIIAPDMDLVTSDSDGFLRVLDGVKRLSAVMDGFADFLLTDESNDQLVYTDDSPLTT